MAIHVEQKRKMGGGVVKGIEESARRMFLDILQKYQYQFPFKSTVREVMSNGIDSVTEKRVAREILTGKAKVEEYYAEMEGEIYKDSRFDPSYYDLAWLDDQDKVELRYIVRPGQKDLVEISDSGVGLGSRRLQGYLSLGYSSKRLSRLPLGKFGIGGKSPLSTNVDFYTVDSYYNGWHYKFNIYSNTFDSIIPRLNLQTGGENRSEIWNAGTDEEYVVYSEPTTRKNGLIVSIESKKHNQQEYISAVKSQLLYFPNVSLVIKHEDGREEPVDFRAEILYEDEYILLSKQQYWSKPHILLNKVNYGYVNWEELELKQYGGSIGIKVIPEEVEVNPNRESLIWSETTKVKMLERINNVKEIATKLVQQKLQTTDFLEWYRLCTGLGMTWKGGDDVAARLSSMVDVKELSPYFPGDPRIKFYGTDAKDPTNGLWMRYVKLETNLKLNKQVKQIVREEIYFLQQRLNEAIPVILMSWDEKASNRKDKYLCSLYPNGFIAIYEPYTSGKDAKDAGMSKTEYDRLTAWLSKNSDRAFTREEAFGFVATSKNVLIYSEVEVPEDFGATEAEEDAVVETVEEEAELRMQYASDEERRKAEGKIVLYTPRRLDNMTSTWDEVIGKHVYEAYSMFKVEVPIKEINDWNAPEVYYGHDEDRELLLIAAILTNSIDKISPARIGISNYMAEYYSHNHNSAEAIQAVATSLGITNEQATTIGHYAEYGYDLTNFCKPKVMLLKIAQSNQKYFRNFLHIQNFFLRIKNKRVTMSDTLIKWNTARRLKESLRKCAFLRNFELFNPEYAAKFKELQKYVDDNYRSIDAGGKSIVGLMGDGMTTLIGHLDNTFMFQEYVHNHPEDLEGIAQLAQDLFGNKEISGAQCVEMEQIDTLNELLEYAIACGPLLNEMSILTAPTLPFANIPQELEMEIRNFLQWKGVSDWNSIAEVTNSIENQRLIDEQAA